MKQRTAHSTVKGRFWVDRREQLSLSGLSVRGDWFLLVLGSSIILLILLASSWWSYRTISTKTILNEETRANTKTTVNEEQLARVTEQYRARAERFAELTDGFVLTGSVVSAVSVEGGAAGGAVATSTASTTEETQ